MRRHRTGGRWVFGRVRSKKSVSKCVERALRCRPTRPPSTAAASVVAMQTATTGVRTAVRPLARLLDWQIRRGPFDCNGSLLARGSSLCTGRPEQDERPPLGVRQDVSYPFAGRRCVCARPLCAHAHLALFPRFGALSRRPCLFPRKCARATPTPIARRNRVCSVAGPSARRHPLDEPPGL